MKLLKTRPIAILILIVSIILSTLLGSSRSLKAARSKVEDYFYTAGETELEGYSINGDLKYMDATAGNLITVAKRSIDGDPALTALENARGVYGSASTIREKYEAMKQLVEATENVYQTLDPNKMKTADREFRSSLHDDILSAKQRIAHNDYNDLAREFNEMLKGFPTAQLARLLGVEPVQLFD